MKSIYIYIYIMHFSKSTLHYGIKNRRKCCELKVPVQFCCLHILWSKLEKIISLHKGRECKSWENNIWKWKLCKVHNHVMFCNPLSFPLVSKVVTLNDGPLLNQVKRRWNLQQNNIIKTCFYPNLCELSGTSYKYKHK